MQTLDSNGKVWGLVRKITKKFASRPCHSYFIDFNSVLTKLDNHVFRTPATWYNHVRKLYSIALTNAKDDISRDVLMQLSYKFEKSASYLNIDSPSQWCLSAQQLFSTTDALMKSCPFPFLLNTEFAQFIESNADHFPPRPVHLEQANRALKRFLKKLSKPSSSSGLDVSNFYLGAFKEKLIDLNSFQEIRPLGSGTYAHVTLEEEMNSGHLIAVKTFSGEQITQRQIAIFCREVSILAMHPHPSILPFVGFTNRDRDGRPSLIIATEYMPHGTLRDMLDLERRGHAPSIWNNTQKSIVALSIACGLRYLHERSVIHRDLKSMNILMDEMYEPKIADMGYAKVVTDGDELTMRIGSCLWMAPEVITSHEYDFTADVYSFGMVLYEMVTGEMPFGGCSTPIQVHEKVLSGVRPELPDSHHRLCKLIRKCWSGYPDERPSSAQVVEQILSGKCLFDGTDLEIFHAAAMRLEEHEGFKMDIVLAVSNNFYEIVRSIVRDPCADLNLTDEFGCSGVHISVLNDSAEILQILLTAPGIDVNKVDEQGKTALHYAVERHSENCLRLLLTREDLLINSRDLDGNSAFLIAVRDQNDIAANLLLSRLDTNVNIINCKGETALTLAIAKNTRSIIYRISTSFRVKMDLPCHKRLLRDCIHRRNLEIFRALLLIPDINVNEEVDGETPLTVAVHTKDVAIMMCLLAYPKLDLSPEVISPLLMQCVNTKDLQFLRLLLSMDNVNMNYSEDSLVPPLIYSVFMNNIEAISLLVNSPNIDVNIKEFSSGHTALHFAVQNRKLEIVRLLMMSPRVNPQIKNSSGQTPMDIAPTPDIKKALRKN